MIEMDKKIELLKKIAHKFNEVNITWALGASMLLYFKNITPDFHDIDLLIADSDIECVKGILNEMGTIQPSNPNPMYRTKAFMEFIIDSVEVDVMAGFAIVKDGVIYDCSLNEEQVVEWMPLGGERIPLQSPMLWCKYYKLMGRNEKAATIEKAMLN